MKYPTPTAEGHYWAKWRIAEDGSMDEPDPGNSVWEVVQVYDNSMFEDGELRVFVPGEAQSQSLENFYWGPIVLPPGQGGLT